MNTLKTKGELLFGTQFGGDGRIKIERERERGVEHSGSILVAQNDDKKKKKIKPLLLSAADMKMLIWDAHR